jgi:signal transduction histidine kinase
MQTNADPGRRSVSGRYGDAMRDAQLARALEDARSEVADALHDGVVQSMTAVMMRIALASLDAPAEISSALDEIELELAGVVAELRDLVAALRPTVDQS